MVDAQQNNRMEWSMARTELCQEVLSLGFPGEFGDLLAKELGSPRSIRRMIAYLRCTTPHSVEMIVDEMLAIQSEADHWRELKESQEAQASYTAWLNRREQDLRDPTL